MKKRFLLILSLTLISVSSNYGQVTTIEKGLQAITSDAIKAQLGFLSSDWTEGRETGEKGEYLASDYIASMLQYMVLNHMEIIKGAVGIQIIIWIMKDLFFKTSFC